MSQQQQQPSMNNAFIQNLKQVANTIKASSNPQAMLQNMILQNPKLKDAMSLIRQMGTPEQALNILAAQKGLDSNQIIQAIKSL